MRIPSIIEKSCCFYIRQKNFELYISHECTRRTLRNDASCSKIPTSSVLQGHEKYCGDFAETPDCVRETWRENKRKSQYP